MPTPTALQWAHLALDGGLFRLTTSNDDLGPIRDEIQERLVEQYPCIGPDPEVTLTGGALTAWKKWLGYETAIAFVQSGGTRTPDPARNEFGLVEIQTKSGEVTEKFGAFQGKDFNASLTDWNKIVVQARARIPCVASALSAKAAGGKLVALSGRKRSGERP